MDKFYTEDRILANKKAGMRTVAIGGETLKHPFKVGDRVYVVKENHNRSENDKGQTVWTDSYYVSEKMTVVDGSIDVRLINNVSEYGDNIMYHYYTDDDSDNWIEDMFKLKRDAVACAKRRNAKPHIVIFGKSCGEHVYTRKKVL